MRDVDGRDKRAPTRRARGWSGSGESVEACLYAVRVDRATRPRSILTRYALVILDFDGTLADSLGWFVSVFNRVARRYRFREGTSEDFVLMRSADPRTILHSLGVPRWKLPFIARHMREMMAKDIDQIQLFPGIDRMIRDLHGAGVRLAAVSSNSRGNVMDVLGAETSAFIDHYACGASLFGKAAKFRDVLKWSGLPPHAVLAVGDEVRDIEAATAVGIASGAVLWGYATAEVLRAKRPTIIFETVEAIAPFVQACESGA